MSPVHPSASRRAPERAIISPHAATTSPLASSAAAAAAARMSPVPAAWVSPPLSPELAPPGAAGGGGLMRGVSPLRDRGLVLPPAALPPPLQSSVAALRPAGAYGVGVGVGVNGAPSARALRASERVAASAAAARRCGAFVAWLGFVSAQKTRSARVAAADAAAAHARVEAAEARADRCSLADAQQAAGLRVGAQARVDAAERGAEEARVTAAAALHTLEEARAELAHNRREFDAAMQSRAGGDAALTEAQLRLQEAQQGRSQALQELAGVRAAAEQREVENQRLREQLAAERARAEQERLRAARDGDDAAAHAEVRATAALAEVEAARREAAEAHAARAEVEALRAKVSAARRECDGLRQGDGLLREQLESRLRELEAVHLELKGSRAENMRLHERLQMNELKALQQMPGPSTPHSTASSAGDAHAEVLRHTQGQTLRLEEQLRERAAAAAAAEAQLASSGTLLVRAEGEAGALTQRVRWLEEELVRQQHVVADLNRQTADLRAEKEQMLRECLGDRATAAAAEAQQAAGAEKAGMLAAQLEATRAEAIDARVQLTELRAQLASALARLEGREDALVVLREELARAREQLAAAEELLGARARSADEKELAQRAADEKQRLIDHLESRVAALVDALELKEKEALDLRLRLDDAAAQRNQCAAERDALARELRAVEEELARLRLLVAGLQEQLAGVSDLRDENDALRRRVAALEADAARLKEEAEKAAAERAEALRALEERTREVELLTEELKRQTLLGEAMARAQQAAQQRLAEAEALLARERAATQEADARGALVAARERAGVEILRAQLKRNQRGLAEVLEKKNAALRLMPYWTALAGHAGRQGKKQITLFVQEKELLTKAVTDLHGVVKEQAKKLAELERKLAARRRAAAELLARTNRLRTLARGYWLLYCNRRKGRPAARTVSVARTGSGGLRTGAPGTVVVHRRAQPSQAFLFVRLQLAARYFRLWREWRRRVAARRRVPALQRRSEETLLRRGYVALLANAARRLRKALESGDHQTLASRSRVQRRFEQARRCTAAALEAYATFRLRSRCMGKLQTFWQETRVGRMTTRMRKIEGLLTGKEKPGDWGLGGGGAASAVEQAEAVARLELQRQEAAAGAKLERVAADIRVSAAAAALLAAELEGAFAHQEKDELLDRAFVEGEAARGWAQLLQDALWESQLGWGRRGRLAALLQAELDASAGQNTALNDHLLQLTADRDAVASRSFHESRRSDLAEAEVSALARARAALAADNAALSKQLEATAAHLSGVDELAARASREGVAVVDLRQELAARDGHLAQLRNALLEAESRLAVCG